MVQTKCKENSTLFAYLHYLNLMLCRKDPEAIKRFRSARTRKNLFPSVSLEILVEYLKIMKKYIPLFYNVAFAQLK